MRAGYSPSDLTQTIPPRRRGGRDVTVGFSLCRKERAQARLNIPFVPAVVLNGKRQESSFIVLFALNRGAIVNENVNDTSYRLIRRNGVVYPF